MLGVDMVQRRQRAEHAGVADENVETAPAPKQRLAEPIDRRMIPEIAGDQGRRVFGAGARGADFVVEFLERALRARESDDMRALGRQGQRHGAADAARGAGDERNAGSESFEGCIHSSRHRLLPRGPRRASPT